MLSTAAHVDRQHPGLTAPGMAPSNTLMIHMDEKLLPKEKNKVSKALDRITLVRTGLCSVQGTLSTKQALHGKRWEKEKEDGLGEYKWD